MNKQFEDYLATDLRFKIYNMLYVDSIPTTKLEGAITKLCREVWNKCEAVNGNHDRKS